MPRLLVIAPNPTFRNSLRFALEAEGHDVTAVASTSAVERSPSDFECTILDHHGIEADGGSFLRRYHPIVLLANEPTHPLASQCFRTLTKPSLGAALSEAVRAALASRAEAH